MKKAVLLIGFVQLVMQGMVMASARTIDFTYVNEDLTNIINTLANKEGKNIILPQGSFAITQKVNLKLGKVPLDIAWRYVTLFLELAGYTIVPHNTFLMIVKNDQNSNRESLPLYVGFEPNTLPFSDPRIRVIVPFNHLKVPEKFDPEDKENPMSMVLGQILSANKSVTYNQGMNAVIVADAATNITTAFTILSYLDHEGDPIVAIPVQLYNVEATTIASLIKTQILALTTDAKSSAPKNEGPFYFGSQPIQLVADPRLNIIIVMGGGPGVERIKDLIAELDQPTESGRSILHYYELQFLDAEKIAPKLENIVKAGQESGQATKEVGGPRKLFEGVIIVAEQSKEAAQGAAQQQSSEKSLLEGAKVYTGGNRLIIAARQDDWLRIKALIEALDKPQTQVIVEVMIVDATIDEEKILGTQLRNPSGMNLPKGVSSQAALLGNPILNGSVSGSPAVFTPTGNLASDLLNLIDPATAPQFSLAHDLSTSNPGSLIISFNDPNFSGIWGVLQVLDQFSTLKVLSHPFLITRNNQEAETIISDIRRDLGQAIAGQAAVISTKFEDIEARLRVAVVPRVSSLDRVNMQIAIDINQFTTTNQSNFTRLTRTINTNTSIGSGQVLVLGGLTTLAEIENNYSIPILSRIPLIGSFFQFNSRTVERQNLLVIMAPTVVDPKIRGGMTTFTTSKVTRGYEIFENKSVLGSPRDPITRTFFKNQLVDAKETTYNYLSGAQGDYVKEFKNSGRRKRKRSLKKS